MRKEKEVLDELLHWAKHQDQVRGMILTSTRTNPHAFVDLFSDYDLELYVRDVRPFLESDTWLEAFGNILLRWPRKPYLNDAQDSTFRLVIFEDGLRIDFGIMKAEDMRECCHDPLHPGFDNGYKILLDKDNLAPDPTPPSYTAYHVKKPTEEEYDAVMDEFWWDITYVAKSLWRDELFYARYMQDCLIRSKYLEQVIEWYIGMENQWAVNLNKHGRWFKRFLDPAIWAEIERTFAGSDLEENWDALFRTADIFRKLSQEIGQTLGYKYPSEMDKNSTGYMLRIRNLSADADDFR